MSVFGFCTALQGQSGRQVRCKGLSRPVPFLSSRVAGSRAVGPVGCVIPALVVRDESELREVEGDGMETGK